MNVSCGRDGESKPNVGLEPGEMDGEFECSRLFSVEMAARLRLAPTLRSRFRYDTRGITCKSGGSMIQLLGVSKTYGGTTVLHELDLSVPDSQSLALVGPSGCGKSTTLRLILGLIRPDSGQVIVQGESIDSGDACTRRHQIGYVIQNGGLFPHLTARENVCLLADHLGWSRERQQQRVDELRELTHLPSDAMDRYPERLSGGQQQRVALMRALMLDPPILLLDEPLGALDPLIRVELQSDLKEIFSQLGKTVVLVTHDVGEATVLGDSLVLLRDGRIVQQGTLRELYQHPAEPFVSDFVNAARSPLEDVLE